MSKKSKAFKREIQAIIAKYDGQFNKSTYYAYDEYHGLSDFGMDKPYYAVRLAHVVVDGERFDMGDFDPEAL